MNPVFCAIDTPDPAHAKRLIDQIAPHVGGIKLGLEFFCAHGPSGIRAVIGQTPLFLDLKFHDIPNTVAGAVTSATALAPYMMTVHASGGKAMMQAARAAAEDTSAKRNIPRPLLLAVSVLTSMDADDLQQIGVNRQPLDQVLRLAELAVASGIDGLVCSPHECAAITSRFGNALKLVVPGVRPAGSAVGDQKRVMTPQQALSAGADFLVIGRPITGADNPADVARTLLDS